MHCGNVCVYGPILTKVQDPNQAYWPNFAGVLYLLRRKSLATLCEMRYYAYDKNVRLWRNRMKNLQCDLPWKSLWKKNPRMPLTLQRMSIGPPEDKHTKTTDPHHPVKMLASMIQWLQSISSNINLLIYNSQSSRILMYFHQAWSVSYIAVIKIQYF